MALPFAGSLHESGARRSASGRAQHLWAAGHLPRLLPGKLGPVGPQSHQPEKPVSLSARNRGRSGTWAEAPREGQP